MHFSEIWNCHKWEVVKKFELCGTWFYSPTAFHRFGAEHCMSPCFNSLRSQNTFTHSQSLPIHHTVKQQTNLPTKRNNFNACILFEKNKIKNK